MSATSFVNERSAEYLLARDLAATLSIEHETVIPLFFWKTREGGKRAAEGMARTYVRLVTAFARRPKVTGCDDRELIMKINRTLFEAAEVGRSCGSPVLAGVPVARSLLEFTLNARCLWFRLRAPAGFTDDVEIHVAAREWAGASSGDPVEGPLGRDQILEALGRDARPMRWAQAVEAMSQIRGAGSGGHWRFGGYRPFFVVLPELGASTGQAETRLE